MCKNDATLEMDKYWFSAGYRYVVEAKATIGATT